jgi:hypothetical protein
MIEITSERYRCCDGFTRRGFLQVGVLSALGLTMPDLLRLQAANAATGAVKNTAAILIWLGGGQSHIDMYDLKPDAPTEFRGEFKPIATNVAGVQICEHLPIQAKVWDKVAVVRSVTHKNAGHGMASHWMMTGYEPTAEINNNRNPNVGAVTSRMRGANRPGLPAYVTVPGNPPAAGAAYLGAAYNPFMVGSDPNNANFSVRDLQAPKRIEAARLLKRRELLATFDHMRRDADTSGTVAGMDRFYQEAFEIVTGPAAREAFDISKEDPKTRDRYGRHTWGQSCLLARRLVEAGVTFVTVDMGGWDTHSNNFNELKTRNLPRFDQAFGTLVEDLAQRGLHEKVLVFVMGEFGRTPRINSTAGRDHWPGANAVVYAGGGLKMGQAVGATDARAEYPAEKPYSPQDVLATVYHVLGIDPHHVFMDEANRPLPVVNYGNPIPELL